MCPLALEFCILKDIQENSLLHHWENKMGVKLRLILFDYLKMCFECSFHRKHGS